MKYQTPNTKHNVDSIECREFDLFKMNYKEICPMIGSDKSVRPPSPSIAVHPLSSTNEKKKNKQIFFKNCTVSNDSDQLNMLNEYIHIA